MLYGATSQRIRGAVGAFVVRVSPDGKRFSRVMFHLRESCIRRVITPNFTLKTGFDYFSEQFRTPIRRNGTFVEQARATSTDNGVTLRYSVRLAGTIGATGARGTYRSNRSLVTKRTGRLRERCATTPPIRWTAAP